MTLCPECFGVLKIEPAPPTGNIVECPNCGWRRLEREI